MPSSACACSTSTRCPRSSRSTAAGSTPQAEATVGPSPPRRGPACRVAASGSGRALARGRAAARRAPRPARLFLRSRSGSSHSSRTTLRWRWQTVSSGTRSRCRTWFGEGNVEGRSAVARGRRAFACGGDQGRRLLARRRQPRGEPLLHPDSSVSPSTDCGGGEGAHAHGGRRRRHQCRSSTWPGSHAPVADSPLPQVGSCHPPGSSAPTHGPRAR